MPILECRHREIEDKCDFLGPFIYWFQAGNIGEKVVVGKEIDL